MKKQRILIIVLAVVLIVGLVWFVSNYREEGRMLGEENNNTPEDEILKEDEEDIEDREDEKIEDSEDPEPEDQAEDEPVADIAVGAPAPDFTLKNLQGEEVSLSDFRGNIVLINFWATWCTFCDREMPDLRRLDTVYDDVTVLAVNLLEDRDKVADYIEKGEYDFEVVLDEEGEVGKTYYVNPLPTSYFVEEDGTLIGRIEGMLEYDQMVNVIENIKGAR